MSGIKRDRFDAVVSDLIRESSGSCESCGKTGRMECSHIFGRRHANLRYDLANLLCLCSSCHSNYTENPVLFTNWLVCTYGQGYLDRLIEKKRVIKRWKKWEKEEMLAHYRAELKRIREGGEAPPLSYQ